MAKYEAKFKCGHTEIVQLYGPKKKRTWKLEQFQYELCPACRQAEREQKNQQAAAANAAAGLPVLEGTPKQVAWAESIRAEILSGEEEVRARIAAPNAPADQVALAEKALKRVRNQSSAAWWIEHRHDPRGYIPADLHLVNLVQAAAKEILKEGE